jgi:transposase
LTENPQHPGKVYHIADAAFYTAENLATLGTHTFWISRVPATLNEAKELVAADLSLQPCTDDCYRYAEQVSDYAGIPQKWVVYHSAPMQEQQEKTFAKRLENDKKKAETSLRKLGAREFACEPDARVAAGKWLQEHPLFRFISMDIRTITRKKTKKRGRPKAGEPVETVYTVAAEIEYNPEVVAENRQKLGRFVLATNDLELSPDELLANYKEQGTVEQGFWFLKDPSFRVAEIYLKKPSRIPGAGDDHGPLPVRVCDDRAPAPPEPAGDRRNGGRPDEEADSKTNPEVGVLPLPRSPGTQVPGRGGGDGDGDEHDPGTLEDTPVAREGV